MLPDYITAKAVTDRALDDNASDESREAVTMTLAYLLASTDLSSDEYDKVVQAMYIAYCAGVEEATRVIASHCTKVRNEVAHRL